MKMNKRRFFILALSLILVIAAAAGTSIAYFTTYVAAKGSQTIKLGNHTEITEEYDDFIKYLTIHNDASSGEAVFIRAKAYADDSVKISYSDYDGKWNPGDDDFYYFADPVAPGKDASVLKVNITETPQNPEEGDTFNIVVLYEATAVRYREDGTAYADWNSTLDVVTIEMEDSADE